MDQSEAPLLDASSDTASNGTASLPPGRRQARGVDGRVRDDAGGW
jgi:hypothetical protein